MNQGITDIAIFTLRYLYFQYHQHNGQSKIFQNLYFTLLGFPLK